MRASCETHSPEETERLGERIASRLQPGDVVALTGDIGAGKTCFTRGLARGLGSTTPASSPTFVLVHRHDLPRPGSALYHLDLYRLDSEDELEDIGGRELMYGPDICVVEWAERAAGLIPDGAFTMRIELLGLTSRRFAVSGPRSILDED